MNRFVLMVDAGYLLRQAIELVSQRASSSRADLELLDAAALVQVLIDKSRATLELGSKELLRVYWYDGVMPNGFFSGQQRAIIDVDDVQFRAGTIDSKGQQKGVDSLIVTDLIELTSHRAICDAILVTGDSDLAVGIELAQRRGVRVALLGVEDAACGIAHHQSFELTRRADRIGRLGSAELAPLFRWLPALSAHHHAPNAMAAVGPDGVAAAAPPQSQPAALGHAAGNGGPDSTDQAQIAAAVQAFIAQQGERLAHAIDQHTRRIDAAIDAALLHHVFLALGRGKLTDADRVFARQVLRAQVA